MDQAAEKAKKAEEKARRKAEFEAKLKKENEAKQATGGGSAEKSKAELKAERRAKQEAQRAAKAGDSKVASDPKQQQQQAQKKEQQQPQKNEQQQQQQQNNQINDAEQKLLKEVQNLSLANQKSPQKSPEKELSRSPSTLKMSTHLPTRPASLKGIDITNIPAVMVNVGSKMNRNEYKGTTAQCVALCTAFRKIVADYEYLDSSKNDLIHDLQKLLFVDCVKFLSKCCPITIAMDNTLKYLKKEWANLERSLTNDEMKENIDEMIRIFIEQQIVKAMAGLIKNIQSKINSDDTIMTLGYSMTIKNALIAQWKKGKHFQVIVVDTRPKFEGKQMADMLTEVGIPTTYCMISAISYVMATVTRVFVEAHALMGNGNVMAHAGATQIALVAKAFNVQFLVCCEQFKFSDRVYTDSFGYNELGNEKEFFSSQPPEKRLSVDSLPYLNVMDMLYDLTPHKFVTTVITEKSPVPAIAVPIILRIRETK